MHFWLYRVLQLGVLLLAAGTILGGVWASYSWGRFWGWDPKEAWALIALLGYLAMLHGGLIGGFREFRTAGGGVPGDPGGRMARSCAEFGPGGGVHLPRLRPRRQALAGWVRQGIEEQRLHVPGAPGDEAAGVVELLRLDRPPPRARDHKVIQLGQDLLRVVHPALLGGVERVARDLHLVEASLGAAGLP